MRVACLLKLQIVYAITAILFNVVSLLRIKFDLAGLTDTNPVLGIAVISPIIISAWAALKGYNTLFLAINSALIPLFIYAGIVKHLPNFSLIPLASIFTSPLVLAIVINCFGVIVMTMGLIAILNTHPTGRS